MEWKMQLCAPSWQEPYKAMLHCSVLYCTVLARLLTTWLGTKGTDLITRGPPRAQLLLTVQSTAATTVWHQKFCAWCHCKLLWHQMWCHSAKSTPLALCQPGDLKLAPSCLVSVNWLRALILSIISTLLAKEGGLLAATTLTI